MKELNLNDFSRQVCINDILVFRIGLGFIRDTTVLANSGFKSALLVETFALFCCLVSERVEVSTRWC